MHPTLRLGSSVLLTLALTSTLTSIVTAQGTTGSVAGRVTDTSAAPVPNAMVQLVGTLYGTRTREDGSFRFDKLTAGDYRIRVRILGYAPESTTVSVKAGQTAEATLRLPLLAVELAPVIAAAHRGGETKVAALERQQEADNLVTVLSGDEIRALPNGNAAEAAGRMPDVSIERDEGEGKFVQIRGTEPRLSNVTVDGVHIPGTQSGDRIVKLDDVPSDVLSALEVSKTLTADMDADAIGGSLNLVTKVPEGLPRGYVALQYGRMTLQSRDVTQGSFNYGGRFGADQKFGFLLGGSLDRNNRAINDVEPSWTVDSTGRSIPVEWSQRDYTYYRTRYGLGTDIDYRYGSQSSVYLRGLWSLFKNHGTRYVYDIATSGDSAGQGGFGYGTGATLTRQVQQRTPTEQLWGFTAGGRTIGGAWGFDYSAHFSGTRSEEIDYRTSSYAYAPSGANSLTFRYDASDTRLPKYQYLSAAQQQTAENATNFPLTGYDASNGLTTGHDWGGEVNATRAFDLGANPSTVKFGVRVRDESRNNTQNNVSFAAAQPYSMAQAPSSFSDPNFYNQISEGFFITPAPDLNTSNQYEDGNPGAFTNQTDTIGNKLAAFTGSELIAAGYVMNTVDLGALRLNIGVRVEVTHSNYTANAAATPVDSLGNPTGPTTVNPVTGKQDYTDVFPSLQARYALDHTTSFRFAVTRAIARPNYSDIAPTLQGNLNPIYKLQYGNLSAGNPDLKAEHAWSGDLLLEKFLPKMGGVFTAGVFYKALSDVILTRNFTYQGPYTPFVGYNGTRPENGGNGHISGVEAQWVQHFTFLPGALRGVGMDLNWTHIDSKVLVDPASGREAPLLRQAPDIGNAALLYDLGPVSARFAWTYNGAYIGAYGDGSTTANGDNYFEKHSQIDASVIYNFTQLVQLQLMALSLNNAEFGFFQGTPGHQYNVQREYYGRTVYLGVKYGF